MYIYYIIINPFLDALTYNTNRNSVLYQYFTTELAKYPRLLHVKLSNKVCISCPLSHLAAKAEVVWRAVQCSPFMSLFMRTPQGAFTVTIKLLLYRQPKQVSEDQTRYQWHTYRKGERFLWCQWHKYVTPHSWKTHIYTLQQ